MRLRHRLAALAVALVATSAVVLAPATTANAATNTPVIFVHGYTGNASNWTTALSVFRAGGFTKVYTYDYNWAGSNEISAAGLRTFVNQVRSQTGAAKVAIVNHSMGGLVTRWYLEELGGSQYVSHVASIAGANHGTTFAGACLINISCIEMYPGSLFILDLSDGDETPGSAKYASWYSACDGIILPYTSTRLTGATNNNVACETHIGFLTNTSVLTQIRSFIAA
ncbi:triacylglycerol lipase [Allocatelliglobosispora scoriae]|uniref:Triacylglycerol lipase n=1 Tax=Allocatelliglobosispora scoriae TaxID=643052 RepID=A0A841BIU3_9ACTN|nr:alpha/beta fold hydrolase [Allocatelliglobosispora scoriae]MBB5867535.1 triacylglycerol lipase [Allocatelliglobosispora scoriae]